MRRLHLGKPPPSVLTIVGKSLLVGARLLGYRVTELLGTSYRDLLMSGGGMGMVASGGSNGANGAKDYSGPNGTSADPDVQSWAERLLADHADLNEAA